MTPERYKEIQTDMSAKLTKEELAEGWFFCNYEWDGLLVKKGCPEAEICKDHCNCGNQ